MEKTNSKLNDYLTLVEFKKESNKRYLVEALAKVQEYEERGFSDAYIIGYLKGTIKSAIQNLDL